MPKAGGAPITGAVLEWALDDAGVDAATLAAELLVAPADVHAWLRESEQPTPTQLTKMSKSLGRPPSFFFLDEPPTRPSVGARFRTFAGTNSKTGKKTIKAIQVARNAQTVQKWLRQMEGAESLELPQISVSTSIDVAASLIQQWLSWSITLQTGTGATEASVSRAMRGALQDKGIIVLGMTLDEQVTRGFSLWDPLAPLIAVNTRDPHRARLFSYVHELIHILLGEDSVCRLRGGSGVETFCNRVAAAILLPEETFRQECARRFGTQKLKTTTQCGLLSRTFKVSLRAVAIRAEDLGVGAAGLYQLVNAEAEYKPKGGRHDPEQTRDRPRIRVDTFGHTFVNDLFEARDQGRLRNYQLSSFLSVNESELSRVQSLAAAGLDE